MTVDWNGRAYECVLVDLDTQRDYCQVDGACPVANLEELIPALRRVVAWAKRNGTPVISSIESHRFTEVPDNGRGICCLDGSPGQRKIGFTMLWPFTHVEVDNTPACPMDLFKRFQQVIFRKRTVDLLANPKADRFFNLVSTGEFILFGVGTEDSIKALALGLLAREKRVTVVSDACGYWSKATAELAIRQMAAKGVRIVSVAELSTRRPNRRRWHRSARGSAGVSHDGAHREGGNRRARLP